MHKKKFICARVVFFARSPIILLILVLLLRCCHRVSCTNLGLENFARILGHLLANWKQHASCIHNSHKSPRSICKFILNHHGCCRCRCGWWRRPLMKCWDCRLPWVFSSNGGMQSLEESCSRCWNW